MRTAIVLSAAATLLAASAITVSAVASATPARHPSSATPASPATHALSASGQSSARQSVHRTVVEHAITDTVADIGPKGDSLGDVLAFANPVFGPKNHFRVGSDNGSCVRTKVGAAYECTWTTTFRHGSVVVTGPFYDAADSVLAVTGGTGYWQGVTGQMGLHARNAEGTAYDFRFTLRRP